MVVIDATFLLLLLRPGTKVPAGADGLPVSKPKERIELLVKELHEARSKIVIPTPALSEALVRAGAAASQQIVDYLQKFAVFQVQPFDAAAAMEVAAMSRATLAKGRKKENPDATWAKVKYDRQIVAIAKVCGATTIYSDDRDIVALGKAAKIAVVGVAELPLPAENRQLDFLTSFSAEGQSTGESVAKDETATDQNPTG